MDKKRLSPFSKEFWVIKKGYTEEEALYKINSMRPVYKEYWIERGYDEKEAITIANETQISNSKKGAKVVSSKDKTEHRKKSVRCVEHWLEKGYTIEESKEKVKQVQSTNTIQKYVEKYGEEGFEKWVERNYNWSNRMKSVCENSKKNSISYKHYPSIEIFVEEVKLKRNIEVYTNLNDFEQHIIMLLENKPNLYYTPFDNFVKTNIKKCQIELFEHLGIKWEDIVKRMLITPSDLKLFLNKRGNRQSWRMWVDNKLLRSSYEIYFYKQCVINGIVIDGIDENYPESSMRYDFNVNDMYIEICPMIKKDDLYKQKMFKKKEVFGSILLSSIKEIDEWVENNK